MPEKESDISFDYKTGSLMVTVNETNFQEIVENIRSIRSVPEEGAKINAIIYYSQDHTELPEKKAKADYTIWILSLFSIFMLFSYVIYGLGLYKLFELIVY